MTDSRHSLPSAFGRRLQRERESRRWTLREAGEKCGMTASTIMRAEHGGDMALSNAAALAAVYGVSLDALLAEAPCAVCDGLPPAGFICSACKREAASLREAGTA
jgi:transcriptional regulator with XRE-family HTH domain